MGGVSYYSGKFCGYLTQWDGLVSLSANFKLSESLMQLQDIILGTNLKAVFEAITFTRTFGYWWVGKSYRGKQESNMQHRNPYALHTVGYTEHSQCWSSAACSLLLQWDDRLYYPWSQLGLILNHLTYLKENWVFYVFYRQSWLH